MAQIKVLDLNNAYSLSELSYEDTKAVNGGAIGGATFGINSWIQGRRGWNLLGDIGTGATFGGLGGSFVPAIGTTLGASLSTPK